MLLNEDFLDFLRLLNTKGIRYVLVGGYAAIINGVSRTTGDMDVFVDSTEENATKTVEAINEFGFGFLGFTKEDVLNKEMLLQLGVSPVRIDILSNLDGVEFNEVFETAFSFNEDGVSFKVIHINQLIKNKSAVGRGKDLDDIETLNRIIKNKK
jgi:predicted nucleotidyltransferase